MSLNLEIRDQYFLILKFFFWNDLDCWIKFFEKFCTSILSLFRFRKIIKPKMIFCVFRIRNYIFIFYRRGNHLEQWHRCSLYRDVSKKGVWYAGKGPARYPLRPFILSTVYAPHWNLAFQLSWNAPIVTTFDFKRVNDAHKLPSADS